MCKSACDGHRRHRFACRRLPPLAYGTHVSCHIWPANDLRSSEGPGQNLRKNEIDAQDGAEEIRGRRGHVQKSYSAPLGRSELRKACRNGHFQPHPWHPDLPGKRTAPVERTASPNSEAVLAGTRTGATRCTHTNIIATRCTHTNIIATRCTHKYKSYKMYT